ncbi:MAG: DUF116 domain-containing protein [Gemmatimonadales bacterium]
MPSRPERPELIRLGGDRRLGHEWDEWDGGTLENSGDFDAPPGLFLRWAAGWIAMVAAAAGAVVLLVAPRLSLLSPHLSGWLLTGLAALAALALLWWCTIALSIAIDRVLLPEHLAERGPLLPLMRRVSNLARRFGQRDRVENAAIKVFDRLALARKRRVSGRELLLLIPRCLAKEMLEGVLGVARRYEVPVFVATRGQLARRVIRERRPKAVVAVACERDMVTGLHDVAGKVPVLGLTLTLPDGPCKDTRLDLGRLEEFVRSYLASDAADPPRG